MNELKNNNTYAYRSYHRLLNYLRMSLRMIFGVMRTLLAMQLGIISVLFVVTLASPVSPWHISISTYRTILPFTFLIYLFHPIIIWRFRRRSQREFQEQTRRGPTLCSEDELVKLLPSGRIPLTKKILLNDQLALQHILITGCSGTGKTVMLSTGVQATKSLGLKGIVHDGKDGELTAKFYNSKTDLIFNPLDQRSIAINIFDFIREDGDFDNIAAAIVPVEAVKERFFINSARQLLDGIFRFVYFKGDRTNAEVWSVLNRSRSDLYRLLLSINSPSATYIEGDTPQSQSCLSTLKIHTGLFRYLLNPHNQPSFSLADWISDEDRQGMIFLTTRVKQREALSPLMSLFINSLASEVLSLRDHPDSIRLILWIDEWGVLPVMPSVKMLLQQGRSKGAVFVGGIQEKSQLDAAYGQEISSSLLNQFSTYIIFRMNNTVEAEFFSKLTGEAETEQTQTSFSSGTREQRESESYHQQRRSDRLILAGQLQGLPNLNCVIKVHGYPITQSKLEFRHYPDIAPAFIPNPAFRLNAHPGDKGKATNNKVGQRAPLQRSDAKTPGRQRFAIDDFDF
jgi:type IV secretory pathway TraG/TraD family ATPase VirD4